VFASPAPTFTSMSFKDAAGCTGPNVGVVTLSGNSNPDVWIHSATNIGTFCFEGICFTIPVTSGSAQVQIATDGMGNPTSAGNNACWVALNSLETPVNTTTGDACIGIDLEGLSSLTATDCNGNSVTLNNVTCTTGAVGFRVHYFNGEPTYGNSFSPANSLGTSCAVACSGFTMSDPSVSGAGNPCPGSHQYWDYSFTVQNCTGGPLTNVKIQGGTAAWLEPQIAGEVTITPSQGWTQTAKSTGRNNVVWTFSGGSIADQSSVLVNVRVAGTVSNNCDEVEYLSGPWSATGTASDNTKVSTTHTSQASFTVDCSGGCQPGTP
jgi:hypothetical protein